MAKNLFIVGLLNKKFHFFLKKYEKVLDILVKMIHD